MVNTTELRRMLTNAVGDQKVIIQNILQDISKVENEIRTLRAENKSLKEELENKSI
jgi:hypothetical protein